MTVTKHISELGKATRFGADWPGERCGSKTRRGTECQRPAHKQNGRCRLHVGQSTGARSPEGLKRISEANLKHGKYTQEKRRRQRRARNVGVKILIKLKRLEQELVANGLIKDKF